MVTGTKFEEMNAWDNFNAKIHRGHRMLKLPKSPFIKSVALFFCFTVWANETLKHLYYQTEIMYDNAKIYVLSYNNTIKHQMWEGLYSNFDL